MFCRVRSRGNLKLARTPFGGKLIFPQEKIIIWLCSEINPFFFQEGYYYCMSMLDFSWHLCPFLRWIPWPCLMYCVTLHPAVVTSLNPHLINFVLLCMKVLHLVDLLWGSGCTGRAWRVGGTFLVCNRWLPTALWPGKRLPEAVKTQTGRRAGRHCSPAFTDH